LSSCIRQDRVLPDPIALANDPTQLLSSAHVERAQSGFEWLSPRSPDSAPLSSPAIRGGADGGQKKVEFRRRALSAETQYRHCVCHGPSARRSSAGFENRRDRIRLPDRLLGALRSRGAGRKQDFERYYETLRRRELQIRVRKVVALEKPRDLAELDDAMAAPQSYRYDSTEILAALEPARSSA